MKVQQTVRLEMMSTMIIIRRVLKVFMIAPSLSLTLSLVRQMIETKTEGSFCICRSFPKFAYFSISINKDRILAMVKCF